MVIRAAGNVGSSPRGRGTHADNYSITTTGRIIPARAGNTAWARRISYPSTDHPRAGGEHRCPDAKVMAYGGSSPRGRGTRAADGRSGASARIIPARAGNTRRSATTWWTSTDHPRAGGEHMRTFRLPSGFDGSSPRGRGTHADRRFRAAPDRIIPARAGNTRPPWTASTSRPDHPRAGGEHSPR